MALPESHVLSDELTAATAGIDRFVTLCAD